MDNLSVQVAQGRSINTINRTSGKAIAKQLAATPDVNSKDPLGDIPKSSAKNSPSLEKKERMNKRGKSSAKNSPSMEKKE